MSRRCAAPSTSRSPSPGKGVRGMGCRASPSRKRRQTFLLYIRYLCQIYVKRSSALCIRRTKTENTGEPQFARTEKEIFLSPQHIPQKNVSLCRMLGVRLACQRFRSCCPGTSGCRQSRAADPHHSGHNRSFRRHDISDTPQGRNTRFRSGRRGSSFPRRSPCT